LGTEEILAPATMWIQSVRLEGFKSFKDRTVISFDKGHTLVIGHNGAGKSNLLSAIAAIMDMEVISTNQRRQLLNPNSGSGAKVEVIVNNELRRLPVNSDKVSIVRHFLAKKDDIRIDGKVHTRQEFLTLLESAGISADNRFNVVKTADVVTLCNTTNADRLRMIQELAGIGVYTENKKTVDGYVAAVDSDIKAVNDMLDEIQGRLANLDLDRQALDKYKRAENKVKVLNYVLLERQIEDISKKLKKAELNVIESSESMAPKRERVAAAETELAAATERLLKCRSKRQKLEAAKAQMVVGMDELETRYSKTNEEWSDMKKEFKVVTNDVKALQSEFLVMEATEADLEAKLKEAEEELSREQAVANGLSARVASHQKRLNVVFNVSGREGGGQEMLMETLQENGSLLASEIAEIKAELKAMNQVNESKAKELEEAQQSVMEMADLREQSKGQMDQLAIDIQGFKNQKIGAVEELRRAQSEHAERRDRLSQAHQTLMKKSGESKNLLLGLDSVHEILANDDKVRDGYYGLLADCFECDESLNSAVSSIAGKRLFFHVVSTRHVATRLMTLQKEMNLSGEITCIPLDTIQPFRMYDQVRQKLRQSRQGQPIVDLLRESCPEVESALRFVFGRFVLVRNTAAFKTVQEDVAGIQTVDCVTLDGDQASRKGVLSGGYFGNAKNSKLAMYRHHQMASKAAEDVGADLARAEESVAWFDAEVHKANAESQKLETKLNRLSRDTEEHESKARILKAELKALAASWERQGDVLKQKQAAKAEIVRTLEDLELDQGREELAQGLKQLQIEYREKADVVRRLKKKAGDLSNQLEFEIHPKMAELDKSGREKESRADSLEVRGIKMSDMIKELKEIRAAQAEKVEKAAQDIEEVVKAEQEAVGLEAKALRHFEKAKTAFEETHLRHQEALARQRKHQKSLDEEKENFGSLGSFPSNESKRKASQLSSTECMDQLKKAKASANKLKDKVNFKAAMASESLVEKRDSLQQSLKVVTEDLKVVQEFNQNVDYTSDQKLQFTIRQIFKYFEEIFVQLAPPGSQGELLLEKRPKVATQDTQSTLDSQVEVREDEEIVGVAIHVKFKQAENYQEIRNLSGGQKTVVALALIFAFQRCNQSPFCILDEVDAALDADRRKQLAQYIKQRSSQGVQYISTTFRQELIASANAFVGIRFDNGVSNVKQIDHNEAREFVR